MLNPHAETTSFLPSRPANGTQEFRTQVPSARGSLVMDLWLALVGFRGGDPRFATSEKEIIFISYHIIIYPFNILYKHSASNQACFAEFFRLQQEMMAFRQKHVG